jgi:hypothetical protein
MADESTRQQWMEELRASMQDQPETSWTIAKFKLVFPGAEGLGRAVEVDNVAAAGACNAQAADVALRSDTGRVEVLANFNRFELRGVSIIIGQFRVVLQEGRRAVGRFQQRYADALWPLHGAWEVPFVIETRLGRLIPRPSDPPVLLRSAEPGEFAIPPIGSWFEKWDPISLVREDDPDGPTLAVIDHAMHCMICPGAEPKVPPFYWE